MACRGIVQLAEVGEERIAWLRQKHGIALVTEKSKQKRVRFAGACCEDDALGFYRDALIPIEINYSKACREKPFGIRFIHQGAFCGESFKY